jgi:hypothetical protein
MNTSTIARRCIASGVAAASITAALLVAPAAANAAGSAPKAPIDAYTQLIFEDNGQYTFIPDGPVSTGSDVWDYQTARSRDDARARAPFLKMHQWSDGSYSFSSSKGLCLINGIHSPSLQFGVMWMNKTCNNSASDSWRLTDDRALENVQTGRGIGRTYTWKVPYNPRYTAHAHVFSGTPVRLAIDVDRFTK